MSKIVQATEMAGCCACAKVEVRRVMNISGTTCYREYWACVDCGREFSPANTTTPFPKRKACYCTDRCMAPRIMGRQMPCLDPDRVFPWVEKSTHELCNNVQRDTEDRAEDDCKS